MAAPQLPGGHVSQYYYLLFELFTHRYWNRLVHSEPQVGKFWEEAQKLIPRAGHEVFDQVIKNSSSEVANGIRDIKNSLVQVVEQAQQIRTDIQKAIDRKDITMEHVTEMFTVKSLQFLKK